MDRPKKSSRHGQREPTVERVNESVNFFGLDTASNLLWVYSLGCPCQAYLLASCTFPCPCLNERLCRYETDGTAPHTKTGQESGSCSGPLEKPQEKPRNSDEDVN